MDIVKIILLACCLIITFNIFCLAFLLHRHKDEIWGAKKEDMDE